MQHWCDVIKLPCSGNDLTYLLTYSAERELLFNAYVD